MTDQDLIAKYELWIANCDHRYGAEADRVPLSVVIADLRRLLTLAKHSLPTVGFATPFRCALVPVMSIEPDDPGDDGIDATTPAEDGNHD